MFSRIRSMLLVGALALACISFHSSNAQEAGTYSGPVAVVVAINIPPGLARTQIEGLFKQQSPAFQKLPGLKQKYFTVNANQAGGIYLFASRAAAEAFFTTQWTEQVTKTYGSKPNVTYFDAPVIIQGPAGMAAAVQ